MKNLILTFLLSIWCSLGLFYSVVNAQEIDRLTEKQQAPFGNLEKTPYFGNVVYASQPDAATVTMFKEQGFDIVINIRELNEAIGFDEQKMVEEQGISYIQIPYLETPDSSADLSNVALSEIKAVIDGASAAGHKILLHCSHGQRAASTLGMILYRDYGCSQEDAFKHSTAAGMSSEWIVPKFHQFIETVAVSEKISQSNFQVEEVEKFGDLNNIVKYKNFYIASQPSIEAINMMKSKGISTVITARAEQENGGFDEQKYVEKAGLKFRRLRIYNDHYGEINDGKINLEALTSALDMIASTTDGDIFVHCGSGDRASLILAAHAYNVDKSSADDALQKAKLAGMKNDNIIKQIEDYMTPSTGE